MGIVLDTSVVVHAERSKLRVAEALESIYAKTNDVQIAFTTMVVAELLHGVYRAADKSIRQRRASFLEELFRDIPIYPFSLEAARIAGRIGGEQGALGVVIPIADLCIGSTAIALGYSVLTANKRHFDMIPDLQILTI